MLYDAYKLKNDILPEESIFNLFLLPARFGSYKLNFPPGQQISAYGAFKSSEELKTAISSLVFLSSIYECIEPVGRELELDDKVFSLSPARLENFDDWLAPNLQKERIKVYIKTLPIISKGYVSISKEIPKTYKFRRFDRFMNYLRDKYYDLSRKIKDFL